MYFLYKYDIMYVYMYVYIYMWYLPTQNLWLQVIGLSCFLFFQRMHNTWSRDPSGLKYWYQSSIGVDHSLYMEFFCVFVYDILPIADV